jgi:hypothetical protein
MADYEKEQSGPVGTLPTDPMAQYNQMPTGVYTPPAPVLPEYDANNFGAPATSTQQPQALDPMAKYNQMPVGGQAPLVPNSPSYSTQQEALAAWADKLRMNNPYGENWAGGTALNAMGGRVPYDPSVYAPKMPMPLGMPDGGNQNNQRNQGGGSGGGSGNAWQGAPGAGMPQVPSAAMPAAASNLPQLRGGQTNELELPDYVWQFIPEGMRARFNEAMQTWLRLRGFRGRGNIGQWMERSYQKPQGMTGNVWFEPDLFKAFSDPQMGTWANWLLGELGYTNKIEKPLTDSTTPPTPNSQAPTATTTPTPSNVLPL